MDEPSASAKLSPLGLAPRPNDDDDGMEIGPPVSCESGGECWCVLFANDSRRADRTVFSFRIGAGGGNVGGRPRLRRATGPTVLCNGDDRPLLMGLPATCVGRETESHRPFKSKSSNIILGSNLQPLALQLPNANPANRGVRYLGYFLHPVQRKYRAKRFTTFF